MSDYRAALIGTALLAAIAGFAYGQEAAQGALVSGLRNLVSPDLSPAIRTLLSRPHAPSSSWVAALFGGLVLLFGASSVLTELHDALNAIWHVEPDPNTAKENTLFSLIKERAYLFAVILGCGALLLITLMLESGMNALKPIVGWRVLASGPWLHVVVFLVAFLGMTFVFAVIYKIIPDTDLTWRDAAVGGIVTSLLFVVGKQFISLYISKSDLGSAYGAAGSLIVFLVWIYYSAQVFFLGAEFTKVYSETFGSRQPPVASLI